MNTTPITVTEEAKAQIKAKTALNQDAVGLRLTIKATGCSGNSYQMEHVLEEDVVQDDKFVFDCAILYVPKVHRWMLFGLEIGYEEEKMKSGFTFTNPNEAGRCGCGESFVIDRPE